VHLRGLKLHLTFKKFFFFKKKKNTHLVKRIENAFKGQKSIKMVKMHF
jgi:hypothetical protein